MSATSSQAQDVSNGVSAPFDTVDGSSPGSWSINYNVKSNLLTFNVQQSQPGAMLDSAPLVSTIDAAGLQDILEFLFQVKARMKQGGGKTS
ncbi:hypothetical protein [Idiomarina xiamenensis]|uniref:Uncharacterized protein n=1 Tax=Idiomarina xiamenensis 10-D-4 TaxID=740709 RepID=K2L3G1_9GAMM|nr:hypothetical protein [Idiomarina xiamenensis]EKE84410.1 hypothetical protein A10D4_05062 [Idiomarina xiamenensis 10-D-4]